MPLHMLGQLGMFVFETAVVAIIGALLLQLAVRWVCRFEPAYWLTFVICLIVYLISSGIQFLFELFAKYSGEDIGIAGFYIFPITFVAGSAIYGFFIRDRSFTPIGFKKGCLVSLMLELLAIFVGCVFMLTLLSVGMYGEDGLIFGMLIFTTVLIFIVAAMLLTLFVILEKKTRKCLRTRKKSIRYDSVYASVPSWGKK